MTLLRDDNRQDHAELVRLPRCRAARRVFDKEMEASSREVDIYWRDEISTPLECCGIGLADDESSCRRRRVLIAITIITRYAIIFDFGWHSFRHNHL